MNKFFAFFCLLTLSVFFISGCAPSTTTPTTNPVTGSTEWCKPGTQWAWTGTTDSGQASASWIMKGLVPFKGDTYCHVTVTSTSTEEDYVIEYYFKETNGETTDVWMIMKDKTGTVLNEVHVTGQS